MNTGFRLLASTGLVAIALVLGTGCNKKAKDTTGETVVDENGKTAPAALPSAANPEAAQALAAANASLQKSDYDAAVAALVQAQQNQPVMSEEQKQKYRQTVQDTTTRLLEAARTDPKAQEAYENFGRLMKGH